MSAKSTLVLDMLDEIRDLNLTKPGRDLLFGYLAELDPAAFRKAIDAVITEDQRGRYGRLIGDKP